MDLRALRAAYWQGYLTAVGPAPQHIATDWWLFDNWLRGMADSAADEAE